MTPAFFFFSAISIASADHSYFDDKTLYDQFSQFVTKYNKQYETDTEMYIRFGIFIKNFDMVDHLNRHSNGATFGITKFADLTKEEFMERHTGYKPLNGTNDCKVITEVENIKTDTNFDWRDKNVVSQVKDQGACGACWAFSTIGNLESVNAIKTGKLQELSEQQLLDCDEVDAGCSGGLTDQALSYLKTQGSISEADYPYGGNKGACSYSSSKVAVKPTECEILNITEDALAQKLQQTGPISIALAGNVIQPYVNGIVRDRDCNDRNIDHAVLLVGFGEEQGVKYWVLKNSWGQNWGEQGYFRIQRGVNCLGMMEMSPVTAVV